MFTFAHEIDFQKLSPAEKKDHKNHSKDLMVYVHHRKEKAMRRKRKPFHCIFHECITVGNGCCCCCCCDSTFRKHMTHNERWMAYAIDIGRVLLFVVTTAVAAATAVLCVFFPSSACFFFIIIFFLLFSFFHLFKYASELTFCTMVVLILYFAPSNKMNELKDLPLSSPNNNKEKWREWVKFLFLGKKKPVAKW